MRMTETLIDCILILTATACACAALALMPLPATAASSEHIGPQQTAPQGRPAAYCAARARLAELILDGMKDGTPIEHINIGFEQPAPTPEIERAREDWVQTLKAEIIFERQTGGPDGVARRIAARCNGTDI